MMEHRHCPSPAKVERACWSARAGAPLAERDRGIVAHVEGCDRCTAAWRDIASLAELGRRIEPARPWERREELRTTLLSSLDQPRTEHAPVRSPIIGRRWWWAAPLAAAAAAAVWLAWPAPSSPGSSPSSPPSVARRAMVLEHPGARAITVSDQPDEVVRLVEGSLTISVPALAATEQLRVITGDGELVASGAAFDVTAREDRLAAVRVLQGQVKILAAGAATTVQRGETWRATTQLAVLAPSNAAPATAAPATAAPATAVPATAVPATPPKPASTHTSMPPSRELPLELPPAPPTPPAPPAPSAPPLAPSEPSPAPIEPAGSAATLPPPAPRSMAQQALDDGWTALRAGDFARAAAAFERAVAVTGDPRLVEDATFWRGIALARAGEVGTAAHVLTAFLTAYPRSPRGGEARVVLGWLLFERGDRADAKVQFEAALQDTSPRVRDGARAGLAAAAHAR